jgi:hypothetical protein
MAASAYDYTIYSEWIDEELTWFPATLSLASTATPAPSGFWEHFDEKILDDNFTGDNGDAPDSDRWTRNNSEVVINSNALRLSTENGNRQVDSNFTLYGDFSVQMDFTLVDHPETHRWYFQMRATDVTSGSADLFAVLREYRTGGSHQGNQYVCYKVNGGVEDPVNGIYVGRDDLTGKLRITRSGDSMAGYYYHPTNGWTLITSEQMVGLTGGVQIGLWMRRSDANPTATILVDNFTVNSADGYSWFEVKLTNDDFTGTNGDPPDVRKWTTYDNVTIQNNKARGVDGGNITCNFEPTGDFSVRVYWDDVGAGTTNAYWHALNVWMDSDNYMDIAVGYWGSQRQYAVNGKVGGATFQSVVATSHTDGRFSIVRSGVTTSATYWSGTSWVQAGISDEANQTLGTGPAKIALYTSRWSAPPSTIVDWDNFMLLSADSVDWQVGDKVYFTDSDSNKLYAEIETFDVATSAATYHIAVPVVPSGSNTPITMNWDWDSSKTYDVRELPPEDYRDAFTGTNGSSPDTTKWYQIGSNTTIQNNKCNQPIAQGFGNSGTYCYWDFSDVGGSITGNFDVQVDFELITYPAASFWGAQLVLEDTDGEGCSLVRGWYGSHSYRTWENFVGWQTEVGTSDTSGKLRVTRVGTTWTTYTWNGSSWDTNHTWDPGTAAPLDTAQVYLRHGNTQPAVETNFDNFQFNNTVYVPDETDDTFAGTDDDDPDLLKWEITAGSPTIQSNALNFSPDGITDQIRTKYQVDDDFDFQIDYSVVSLGTNGEIGIRVWQDNNNYLRIHYKDVSGTTRYQANKMEGGGYSVLGNNIRGPDNTGKLRIRRVGSVFTTYGYWSSAWQQIHSATHSYLDGPLNIDIQVYEQAATTTEANIDNFIINNADSITGWTDTTSNLPAQTVWDDNYKIVVHLADTPTGSADDILDSTSNENHGTSYNMGSGNSGSNSFGKYLSFDGTAEFIDFGDSFYSNTGTVEAIVNITNYSNNDSRNIVVKRNAAGTTTPSTDEIIFRSLTSHAPYIGAWNAAAGLTVSKAGIAGSDTTGTEVYVAGAYDSGGGSDISAQQNDVINTGADRGATAINDTSSAWQIAARDSNDNDKWFLGNIREVRISDIYRSEAWRLATYYSLLGDIWIPVEAATEWTLTIQDLTSLTSAENIDFYNWLLSMQDLTVSTSIDTDIWLIVWLIIQNIDVETSISKQDLIHLVTLIINSLTVETNLSRMQFWRALKTINNTVEFRTLMRTLVSKSLDRTLDSKTVERTIKQIKQLGHFYDNP